MLINEDYFKDLEIEDEDIIEDDTLDVEEPDHDLTVEELHKLPEQYNHCIVIEIKTLDKGRRSATFIKTTLIPRIYKKLDVIFDMYGIEDSLYVLTSAMTKYCNTVVKFGDYQLFCQEHEEHAYVNDTYNYFFIQVFVNYPKFTYKRVFRFLYTIIPNLYRMDRHIDFIDFEPLADDYVTKLYFWFHFRQNEIKFEYYNRKGRIECGIFLCDEEELTEKNKMAFYDSVIRHFLGKGVRVPYKLIDKDVPLKPIKKVYIK